MSNKIPAGSDVFCTWELNDQTETLIHASIKVIECGNVVIEETTAGSRLTLLDNPKRLRLQVLKTDFPEATTAEVEVRATDSNGLDAKRFADPHSIYVW